MKTSLIFALSAVMALVLTPVARRIAVISTTLARRDLRRRHQHAESIPLMGGIAIYLTTVSGILFWLTQSDYNTLSLLGYALPLTVFFALGIVDDIWALSAVPKLLIELITLIGMAITVPDLFTSLDPFLPHWLSVVLFVLWISTVSNGINFIDGLDGLCSGLSGIAALAAGYLLVFQSVDPYLEGVIAFSLAGAALGFFAHNRYPARIFLGDSGSLTIGFLMGVITWKIPQIQPNWIGFSSPIILLGIPILDLLLTVKRRFVLKRPLFKSDWGHLHHRLLQIGISHPKSSRILCVGQIYIDCIVLGMWWFPSAAGYLLSVGLGAGLVTAWALILVERALATHTAQYLQKFLEFNALSLFSANKGENALKKLAQLQAGKDSFRALLIDCKTVFSEIAAFSPDQTVDFMWTFYTILRKNTRDRDIVGTMGSHKFYILLSGEANLEADSQVVIQRIQTKVRELYQLHGIFAGNPETPEGILAVQFPRDSVEIVRFLDSEENPIATSRRELQNEKFLGLKKMKVLQIGKFYAPFHGGIESVTQTLAEGLVRRGDDVTVLCFSHSPKKNLENELNGVRIRRVSPWIKIFSQPLSPTFLSEINSHIDEADLIHVHSLNAIAELGLLRRMGQKPIVCSYHHDAFKYRLALPFYLPVLRRFLAGCSQIVVSSDSFLKSAPQLAPHRQKCTVIPFGIRARTPDANLVQRLENEHGKFLLFVGRLVGYKGLKFLITAMKPLSYPLVLVGVGPLRKELETLAQNLGISSRIHFVGEIPDENLLAAHYHACQALVLPSISQSETFGMVLLEAMAARKPLITTRLHTGVDWVNQDGETGFVVEPENATALTHAIGTLLENESRLKKMGEASLARFHTHFSESAMVEGYRTLYRTLVEPKFSRAG